MYFVFLYILYILYICIFVASVLKMFMQKAFDLDVPVAELYTVYTLPRDASATLYASEGCFSDVRGPFRTKNLKNIPKNIS